MVGLPSATYLAANDFIIFALSSQFDATLVTACQERGILRRRQLCGVCSGRSNYVGHLPANVYFTPIAPILCAGVTAYKGLKQTEAHPDQWVVISGVGGLGHLAVQYAKAMGLHVVAVDIATDKLELAKKFGADLTVNALEPDAAQ